MKTKLFLKKYGLWMLVVVQIAFMFSQSLTPGAASSQKSFITASYILAFLEKLHLHFELEAFHLFIRKCAHFAEYFIFGTLIYFAEKKTPFFNQKKYLFLFFFVPVIDELLQAITPNRSCQISDMVLDSFGMLCAILLFSLLLKRKENK